MVIRVRDLDSIVRGAAMMVRRKARAKRPKEHEQNTG